MPGPEFPNLNSSRLQPFAARLVAVVVAINLFVLAFIVQSLYNSRKQYVLHTEHNTQNLAQSVEFSISGLFDKVDMALFDLQNEVERQLATGHIDGETLNAFVRRQRARLPEIDAMTVTDAQGVLRYGQLSTSGEQIVISDREYFQILRATPHAGVVMSSPVTSRLSHNLTLIFARRVNQRDGSFAGVVAASIPIDYLHKMFSAFNIGKHGAIGIRKTDMALVALYPPSPEPGSQIGSKAVAPKTAAMMRAKPLAATYKVVYKRDKIERTLSYRKSASYPLYIFVGQAAGDYLVPWHRELILTLVLYGLFLLLSLFAARQLYKRWLSESTATRKLKQSEQRLRDIFEGSPIGMYRSSLDGRTAMVNRSLARIFGYATADEMIAEINLKGAAVNWPSPEAREASIERIVAAKGRYVQEEGHFVKKDGSAIEAIYAAQLVSEADTGERYITGFVQDVTDSKRLEEQLHQSQKMESIGRLAGGIAHDFNNMLSVILGCTALAKPKLDQGNPLWECFDMIEKAARRSSQITRQLLAFSRKQVIAPKAVDVNAVILESQKNLARLIGEDVSLTFKAGENLWEVLIDPSQIDQIIMNLSVNARDAMPDGGLLAIETSNVSIDGEYSHYHLDAAPGDYVLISVSDTGCGMDQETRAHIFEPFFTTKEVGKGTGLGLSTVYGIVTQNHGFVNVYSEPGQGTVFKIYLPRLVGTASKEEEVAPAVSPTGSGAILLVEDEEMLLWMTTKMLQELGYRVIQAQAPEAAIAICEQGTAIDLILTDVVMPQMNGREMVERIRAKRPGIKALFMSGYTTDVVVQRGIVEEGMHFVQKPLEIKELAEKIRKALAS